VYGCEIADACTPRMLSHEDDERIVCVYCVHEEDDIEFRDRRHS
jgi:hypothetical protein